MTVGRDTTVNIIVSAVIGGILATATLVGGVQAAQGGDQKPVGADRLYSYSDK